MAAKPVPQTPARSERPTFEEVTRRLARVDGALGAAGHHIDDAPSREILRRQAAGEINGDEARHLFRAQEGLK